MVLEIIIVFMLLLVYRSSCLENPTPLLEYDGFNPPKGLDDDDHIALMEYPSDHSWVSNDMVYF